jgi:hypothetical protein
MGLPPTVAAEGAAHGMRAASFGPGSDRSSLRAIHQAEAAA